jgi:hypothetical protein
MGLFKEEQGNIIISPETKLIPEFSKIIKMDKSRSKEEAKAIFEYIYMVYDFKSPYSIYTFEERQEKVAKSLGIDTKLLAKQEIIDAINLYDELNQTPILKTLIKTKETLLASVNVLDKIRVKVEEIVGDEESDAEGLASALTLITRSLSLAEQIPKNVKVLEDLEDRAKKEISVGVKIRGGGTVNYFEE